MILPIFWPIVGAIEVGSRKGVSLKVDFTFSRNVVLPALSSPRINTENCVQRGEESEGGRSDIESEERTSSFRRR